jgi:hypothetical protein
VETAGPQLRTGRVANVLGGRRSRIYPTIEATAQVVIGPPRHVRTTSCRAGGWDKRCRGRPIGREPATQHREWSKSRS